METKRDVIIREMQLADIEAVAEIHRMAFVRQKHSVAWLKSNLSARPKTLCYAAFLQTACIGYIIWAQKSGFRDESVIELEQIAVSPALQGKSVGRRLIVETLQLVTQTLHAQGSSLQHILITTRADNHAQALYRKVLGAEVERPFLLFIPLTKSSWLLETSPT